MEEQQSRPHRHAGRGGARVVVPALFFVFATFLAYLAGTAITWLAVLPLMPAPDLPEEMRLEGVISFRALQPFVAAFSVLIGVIAAVHASRRLRREEERPSNAASPSTRISHAHLSARRETPSPLPSSTRVRRRNNGTVGSTVTRRSRAPTSGEIRVRVKPIGRIGSTGIPPYLLLRRPGCHGGGA